MKLFASICTGHRFWEFWFFGEIEFCILLHYLFMVKCLVKQRETGAWVFFFVLAMGVGQQIHFGVNYLVLLFCQCVILPWFPWLHLVLCPSKEGVIPVMVGLFGLHAETLFWVMTWRSSKLFPVDLHVLIELQIYTCQDTVFLAQSNYMDFDYMKYGLSFR